MEWRWHILCRDDIFYQGCLIFLGDYFTPLFLAHILRLLAAFRSFTALTRATYTHFHEDILYGVMMNTNIFLSSRTEAVMARCFWRIHIWKTGREEQFCHEQYTMLLLTYNLFSISQCAINQTSVTEFSVWASPAVLAIIRSTRGNLDRNERSRRLKSLQY
jgi:hypothetical protein